MRNTIVSVLTGALVLVSASAVASQTRVLTAQQERGRVLAAGLCGGCHSTGKTGASAHIAAPPFREIDRYVDLDKFAQRLREGLLGTHRDMPMFRFTREDATALVAYLRWLQGP
jgi:mono/diheme cytochrome c family protein